jgi:peptidoglycan lytic transglycosylase D
MRGSFRHIVLATLLLPLFGCAQSVDLSSDPGNQISVTDEGADTHAGAAQLLNSGEAFSIPQQQSIVFAPGTLPFVRSKPKAVPPFPLVMNRTIQNYVDEYMAQPQGLMNSFQRSQPYMPEMTSVLEREGLPRDLIYLAFAESAFSPEGAGPWQLSKSTARRFGLVINKWVDERRDPIKSTRAAAEYLATLHDEALGDWRMTLVAWNNGDARLDHYLRLQDASYEKLVASLPRRTRALMNRFMAVAIIARSSKDYGIEPVSYNESPHYSIVPVSGGMPMVRVAERFGTSASVLRSLNPALLRDRTPPGADTYPIRVPDCELQAALILGDF